ncbi:MAG: hypothetical protein V3R99_04530 [Thermoguttaceae bacterium]
MSKSFYVSSIALLLVLATLGCGESEVPPEEVYDPANYEGTVDTNLPPGAQAKQTALKEVFGLIQHEFIEVEDVSNLTVGIEFVETEDQFLEGTLSLRSWEFNGAPTGDDVPVVMTFEDESAEDGKRTVERVYKVSGGPGRHTISREP